MFEEFWRRLQKLFGHSSNPLQNLDANKLKEKIVLLERDQARALSLAEELKERRSRLEASIREENDDLRRREKAKQIVLLNEEISEKEEVLDEIYQQRKLLQRLIRFGERSGRVKEYGLDRIIGEKLEMEKLRFVIDEATTSDGMNMERVNEATKMLDDAFAYGRTVIHDEAIQRVLDDLARDEDDRSFTKPVSDAAIEQVLASIDRRETE